METKHTPGPWYVGERKARGWSDQADYFVYVGEDDIEPSLICRPYATDGYDGVAERNANAALMAAAPDLLAAAIRFMPKQIAIGNDNVPDDLIVPLDVTMGELRAFEAAIAKATGAA